MKSGLLCFLLGAICGALTLYLYDERQAQRGYAVNRVETADNVKDSVARKLQEWKLTPEDIRSDLARTGEVVRAKAAVAGEKISDARIVAVIKSKYVLDRDLSALDINADCSDGRVTLHGTVASPELIGRAVALALDTSGVISVDSKLSTTAKI